MAASNTPSIRVPALHSDAPYSAHSGTYRRSISSASASSSSIGTPSTIRSQPHAAYVACPQYAGSPPPRSSLRNAVNLMVDNLAACHVDTDSLHLPEDDCSALPLSFLSSIEGMIQDLVTQVNSQQEQINQILESSKQAKQDCDEQAERAKEDVWGCKDLAKRLLGREDELVDRVGKVEKEVCRFMDGTLDRIKKLEGLVEKTDFRLAASPQRSRHRHDSRETKKAEQARARREQVQLSEYEDSDELIDTPCCPKDVRNIYQAATPEETEANFTVVEHSVETASLRNAVPTSDIVAITEENGKQKARIDKLEEELATQVQWRLEIHNYVKSIRPTVDETIAQKERQWKERMHKVSQKCSQRNVWELMKVEVAKVKNSSQEEIEEIRSRLPDVEKLEEHINKITDLEQELGEVATKCAALELKQEDMSTATSIEGCKERIEALERDGCRDQMKQIDEIHFQLTSIHQNFSSLQRHAEMSSEKTEKRLEVCEGTLKSSESTKDVLSSRISKLEKSSDARISKKIQDMSRQLDTLAGEKTKTEKLEELVQHNDLRVRRLEQLDADELENRISAIEREIVSFEDDTTTKKLEGRMQALATDSSKLETRIKALESNDSGELKKRLCALERAGEGPNNKDHHERMQKVEARIKLWGDNFDNFERITTRDHDRLHDSLRQLRETSGNEAKRLDLLADRLNALEQTPTASTQSDAMCVRALSERLHLLEEQESIPAKLRVRLAEFDDRVFVMEGIQRHNEEWIQRFDDVLSLVDSKIVLNEEQIQTVSRQCGHRADQIREQISVIRTQDTQRETKSWASSIQGLDSQVQLLRRAQATMRDEMDNLKMVTPRGVPSDKASEAISRELNTRIDNIQGKLSTYDQLAAQVQNIAVTPRFQNYNTAVMNELTSFDNNVHQRVEAMRDDLKKTVELFHGLATDMEETKEDIHALQSAFETLRR